MGATVEHKDWDKEISRLNAIVQRAHDIVQNEYQQFHSHTGELIKKAAKEVKDMTDALHKIEDALKKDRRTLDARTKEIQGLLK